jgi:hypothetical protein
MHIHIERVRVYAILICELGGINVFVVPVASQHEIRITAARHFQLCKNASRMNASWFGALPGSVSNSIPGSKEGIEHT